MSSLLIPIYIMSGGYSSRFGSDKARALFQDKPLILHVAELLAPFSLRLTVVADIPDKYKDLGLVTISDIAPHFGPIGGLYTSLAHLNETNSKTEINMEKEESWCLMVSCDFMGLQTAWLETLLRHRDPSRKIIGFGPKPWDSLFALYRGDLLGDVETYIDGGERAMFRFIERSEALPLPHPTDWERATSINSPDDLDKHIAKQLQRRT